MNLQEEITKWRHLSASQLEEAIFKLLEDSGSNFAFVYEEVMHHIYINDGDLRRRLREAFVKLASKYSNADTKITLRRWETLSDKEIANEIFRMHRTSGRKEFEVIYMFADNIRLKDRIDSVYNKIIAELRQIDKYRKLEKWKELSDSELIKEVVKEIDGNGWASSGADHEFLTEAYPVINELGLNTKIDSSLLQLADLSKAKEEPIGVTGRAIYIASKLKLAGIEQRIIEAVKVVTDPSDLKYLPLLHWLNQALEEYPVPEAEEYLVKQLEGLPKNWYALACSPSVSSLQQDQLFSFSMAYKALAAINRSLADKFNKKLKLDNELEK